MKIKTSRNFVLEVNFPFKFLSIDVNNKNDILFKIIKNFEDSKIFSALSILLNIIDQSENFKCEISDHIEINSFIDC